MSRTTHEDYGRAAWSAYMASAKSSMARYLERAAPDTLAIEPEPEWHSLPQSMRDAWCDAAESVLWLYHSGKVPK